MALLLAGIDEAGYGPTLGPMCVGLTVWRIESWDTPASSPNLWKLLSPHVCRTPKAGAKGRAPSAPIAIADSKLLKRPNDATTVHPLGHLERGVLAALACIERDRGPFMPPDDTSLLSLLSLGPAVSTENLAARWCTRNEHWYDTDATALPVSCTQDHLRISANVLQRALRGASVRIMGMWCRVISESEFNGIVRRTRSKAEVTLMAVGEHLRRVLAIAAAHPDDTVQVVCDRLGGREHYAPAIEQLIEDARVVEADETPERSRYWAQVQGRRVGVSFQVEAEQAHLPVALASMVAKYMRELAMARFNRYWGRRALDLCGAEIKPTAGYSTDARRWLTDARELLSDAERVAMVREA